MTEVERKQAQVRISEFFFGKSEEPLSWSAIVGTYLQLKHDFNFSPYSWVSSAASDTLSWFSDEDEQIVLAEKENLNLLKLE